VGIGLESANSLIPWLCINKPILAESGRCSPWVATEVLQSLAYVLGQTLLALRKRGAGRCIQTVRYAFRHGVDVVSLNPLCRPVRASRRTGSPRSLPTRYLWTVLEAAKVACIQLGETRIGGCKFAPRC